LIGRREKGLARSTHPEQEASMQHKTREELQRLAAVHPNHTRPALTRSQRLERWAELLEREPDQRLRTLHGTEYQDGETRETMRNLGSPISTAFADPILRAEGLGIDTYGEARRFFELTDRQLHDIVCFCHHGATMRAATAARWVRAAINRPPQPGFFARLRAAFFH
jgi:hypothetical protein